MSHQPNHKMQALLEGLLSSMQWWTCGSTIFNTGCPWLSWELSPFRPAKVEKNPQACKWDVFRGQVRKWHTSLSPTFQWPELSQMVTAELQEKVGKYSLSLCPCGRVNGTGDQPHPVTPYAIVFVFLGLSPPDMTSHIYLLIFSLPSSISCRQAFHLVHHCVFSTSTVFGTKKAPVIIFWITRCIFHRILWWSLTSCEMFLKPCSFACLCRWAPVVTPSHVDVNS